VFPEYFSVPLFDLFYPSCADPALVLTPNTALWVSDAPHRVIGRHGQVRAFFSRPRFVRATPQELSFIVSLFFVPPPSQRTQVRLVSLFFPPFKKLAICLVAIKPQKQQNPNLLFLFFVSPVLGDPL